jgi:anaerobic dimethyl sulfoxide reductase subunit C (anchor subunit)
MGLLATAICGSLLHLGRKRNALRALSNLRSSWLSREILTALVLLGLTALAWWTTLLLEAATVRAWAGWTTVPVAVLFLLGISRVYMQRTVPVWNHWRTPSAFTATAVLMGGLVTNVVLWTMGSLSLERTRAASLLVLTVCVVAAGVAWVVSNMQQRARRSGRITGGVAGVFSAVAGLVLLALLVLQTATPPGPIPVVLSWVALALALIDQLARRRDFFARYERLGV